MSSIISDLISSSIAPSLQTVVSGAGSTDVGSMMRTAAGWIGRGLEYIRARPSIAIAGLGAIVTIGTLASLATRDSGESVVPAPSAATNSVIARSSAEITIPEEELDMVSSVLDRDDSPVVASQAESAVSPRVVEPGRYVSRAFDQGETCSICQDGSPEEQNVVGHETREGQEKFHKFHTGCISQWKRTTGYEVSFEGHELAVPVTNPRGCPLCRAPITSIEGEVEAAVVAPQVPAIVDLEESPLFNAISLEDLTLLNQLIAAGADINAQYDNEWSFFHDADLREHLGIIKALIATGAEIDAQYWPGRTPLHFAVNLENCDTVRILIDADANVNVQDGFGHTPIHLAAINGNLDIVQTLLSAGANRSIENVEGQTALQIAQESGHEAIVAALS